MKKLICLVLAALLCVGAVAMAESSVPSKTTGDFSQIGESNSSTGAAIKDDFKIEPVKNDKISDEQKAACDKQIAEMTAAVNATGSVVSYFSGLTDTNGESVDLVAVLNTDKPKVKEVVPMTMENYDPAYGDVSVSQSFATQYYENEPVVLVVTYIDPETGLEQKVSIIGKGNSEHGVDFTYPAELAAKLNGIEFSLTVLGA